LNVLKDRGVMGWWWFSKWWSFCVWYDGFDLWIEDSKSDAMLWWFVLLSILITDKGILSEHSKWWLLVGILYTFELDNTSFSFNEAKIPAKWWTLNSDSK